MRILVSILFFVIALNALGQLTPKQINKIDSLKNFIETTKNDLDKLNAIKTWDDIIYSSDPSLDKELNLRSLAIAEKNLRKKGLSKKDKRAFNSALVNSLNNLSYHYKDHGDIPKAKAYAGRALKVGTTIKDTGLITASLNGLALLAQAQGDYVTAIEMFTKSLLFHEALNNTNGMAMVTSNIGTLYADQLDYTNALKYYRQSLKIMDAHNIRNNNYSNIFINLGNMTLQLEKYDSCMFYYTKALTLQQQAGDKENVASTFTNIGICYDHLKNYPEAIRNFEKAIKMNEELDNKKGISSAILHLGETYQNLGEHKRAISCFERSISIAKSHDLFFETLYNSQSLYKSYKAIGNYKEADEMNVLFLSLKDSLNRDENKKAMVEQEFKYAYEKKKALDAKENEKQLAIATEQKKKQQIILYSALLGLLMVLVFAVFVVNRLRITRKQKKTIEEQKQEVEMKQKEILDSIHYAKRIQKALLPSEKYINKSLKKK